MLGAESEDFDVIKGGAEQRNATNYAFLPTNLAAAGSGSVWIRIFAAAKSEDFDAVVGARAKHIGLHPPAYQSSGGRIGIRLYIYISYGKKPRF